MLAPAIVALAGPRGALRVVGAALPILVLDPRRRAQATGAGRHWRTSGSGVSSGST